MGFRTFLEFIKVEHSLFSLPFIYAGTLLAIHVDKIPIGNFWSYFLWVTLAAIGARTAAMSLNRIIDRQIDAKNTRTKDRALPAGKMPLQKAWIITIVSALLLFYSASRLNDLALKLAAVPLLFFVIYPYTKRFTWLSHLFLGIIWGIGPLGGWIAVTGSFADLTIPLALAIAGTLWVSGFDIIYAVLDTEFDREQKLYSIPSAFGVNNGLKISFALHAAMFLPLIFLFQAANLGISYLMGILIAFALIAYEHMISTKRTEKEINRAFFDVNAVIGWVILAGILASVL